MHSFKGKRVLNLSLLRALYPLCLGSRIPRSPLPSPAPHPPPILVSAPFHLTSFKVLFVLSFFQGAVARLCEELVEGVAEAIVSFIFIYFFT